MNNVLEVRIVPKSLTLLLIASLAYIVVAFLVWFVTRGFYDDENEQDEPNPYSPRS